MAVEMLVQDADVFETGVHTLAVKGDHGVGGIAENDHGGGVVVWSCLDADEWQVGVGVKLGFKIGRTDEVWGDTGEILGKK